MAFPELLMARFPPSARRLFELTERNVDDGMLLDIARADYGHMAEEAFADLRLIRDTGDIPSPMPGYLGEVLELTRWCRPDRPNPPPFEPGPTGERGHHTRLFACAVLLLAASQRRYNDLSDDSTMAIGLISAGVLGDEFSEAVGCAASWQYLNDAGDPEFSAIALLTVALRTQSRRFTESDINAIATWTLEQETPRRLDQPFPFSIQSGFWHSIAEELKAAAGGLLDPAVRENVQLCALLLDPGWDTSP